MKNLPLDIQIAHHNGISVKAADKIIKTEVIPDRKKQHHGRRNVSFKSVAQRIAQKQNLPLDRAKAVLADGSRNASPAAKRANPKLNRVVGNSPIQKQSGLQKKKPHYQAAAQRMLDARKRRGS